MILLIRLMQLFFNPPNNLKAIIVYLFTFFYCSVKFLHIFYNVSSITFFFAVKKTYNTYFYKINLESKVYCCSDEPCITSGHTSIISFGEEFRRVYLNYHFLYVPHFLCIIEHFGSEQKLLFHR